MQVRFSLLARDQLREIPEGARLELIQAVRRQPSAFPESAPELTEEGYSGFRQLVRGGYRLIYRYHQAEHDEIRVYCVLHVRRRLPPSDFLRYQAF